MKIFKMTSLRVGSLLVGLLIVLLFLGLKYRGGEVCEFLSKRNEWLGWQVLRISAALGNPDCNYGLACNLREIQQYGDPRYRDYKPFIVYFEKAATEGHRLAKLELERYRKVENERGGARQLTNE